MSLAPISRVLLPASVFLFLSLLLLFHARSSYSINSSNSNRSDIRYKFLVNDNELFLEIQFKAGNSRKTKIYLPPKSYFASTERGLAARSRSIALKIKEEGVVKCMTRYPYDCSVMSVGHEPNADVTLFYRPGLYNTLITQNTIVFSGVHTLLYPQLEKEHQKVSFDWSAFKLENAQFFTQLSALQSMPIEPTAMSLEDLFSSWYMFSNSDISVSSASKKSGSDKNPQVITIGLPDNENNHATKARSYTRTQLVELSNKIMIGSQRFIDSMLAGRKLKNTTKYLLFINTGKEQVSNLYSDYDLDVVLLGEGARYSYIAHNISKNYIRNLFRDDETGIYADFGSGGRYHLWFTAGLTDYYSNLLNYRNGIISKEEYIDELNILLKSYYSLYRPMQIMMSSSCVATKQDAQTPSSPFEHNLRKLTISTADIGGTLISLDLDNIIRTRSHGEQSLDDLLRNTIKNSCPNLPCKISKDTFIKELAELTTDDKKAEMLKSKEDRWNSYVEKHIVDFAPITPPDAIFEPKLAFVGYQKQGNAYDYGFDVSKSLCTGVVFGVRRDSNAYKAGVRSGMKMSGLYTSFNEQEDINQLEIESSRGLKSIIKYKPVGEVMVPYYKAG